MSADPSGLALRMLYHRSGTLIAHPLPRSGPLGGGLVVRVGEHATIQREAAAADARGEPLAMRYADPPPVCLVRRVYPLRWSARRTRLACNGAGLDRTPGAGWDEVKTRRSRTLYRLCLS